jgi:hypothetical protein
MSITLMSVYLCYIKKTPQVREVFFGSQIIYKPGSVLFRALAIYLDLTLPIDSSGFYDVAAAGCLNATYLLAAGRVYLSSASPQATVGSYPTRFILTDSFREPAVSFLWHFPWGHPRLPLATAIALCCPDFPLPFARGRLADNLANR